MSDSRRPSATFPALVLELLGRTRTYLPLRLGYSGTMLTVASMVPTRLLMATISLTAGIPVIRERKGTVDFRILVLSYYIPIGRLLDLSASIFCGASLSRLSPYD